MKLSRRGLLKNTGSFLIGAATVGTLALPKSGPWANPGKQEVMDVPWLYKKPDSEFVFFF